MPNNAALQDLVGILETFHLEFTKKVADDPVYAEKTADGHQLTRRLITQHVPTTTGDICLYLKAADLARKLDPEFVNDEPGSALDLLRRAVAAIEDMHLRSRTEANEMLLAVQMNH
jgi:hypothetical protein